MYKEYFKDGHCRSRAGLAEALIDDAKHTKDTRFLILAAYAKGGSGYFAQYIFDEKAREVFGTWNEYPEGILDSERHALYEKLKKQVFA